MLAATPAAAGVELPAVFGDGMVLQRDAPIPVWGRSDPGEAVTVTLAGSSKAATADAEGRWLVRLDEFSAGGPHTLTVQGEDRVTFEDVLVGEVWLGAGQSNMGMRVEDCADFAGERAQAHWPSIRMFREESLPAREALWKGSGEWIRCSPQTVGVFSGTLYFFARRLQAELGVPVGLIESAVGGTPIELWTSPEVQYRSPELAEHVSRLDAAFWRFDVTGYLTRYEQRLARWRAQVALARETDRKPPERPKNHAELHLRKGSVGHLFNAKIAPLVPYGLRGVLWYQGEANTGNATTHRDQLQLLVRDWRARWGQPRLPFAWVQLANFEAGPLQDWPTIREAQRRSLCLPNTGMAVAIDIGDAHDIHPRNKQGVGQRLAAWALGAVYGHDIPTSGPLLIAHHLRDDEVLALFEHTHGGLVARGAGLHGFEVRGADGAWVTACARIVGDRVIAHAPEVAAPTALRYAWAANPRCNLYNGAGLPASPFCTDDLEAR